MITGQTVPSDYRLTGFEANHKTFVFAMNQVCGMAVSFPLESVVQKLISENKIPKNVKSKIKRFLDSPKPDCATRRHCKLSFRASGPNIEAVLASPFYAASPFSICLAACSACFRK